MIAQLRHYVVSCIDVMLELFGFTKADLNLVDRSTRPNLWWNSAHFISATRFHNSPRVILCGSESLQAGLESWRVWIKCSLRPARLLFFFFFWNIQPSRMAAKTERCSYTSNTWCLHLNHARADCSIKCKLHFHPAAITDKWWCWPICVSYTNVTA